MEVKPKDLVIVDVGSPTEEKAFVYMVGPSFIAVCSLLGDKYIVSKDRLSKPIKSEKDEHT